jgi:PIN domain nuclease of toxin-antitoxin system
LILLDTHVWVWWVNGDRRLPAEFAALIRAEEATGLGLSVFSCWEVAKKTRTWQAAAGEADRRVAERSDFLP